MRVEKINDTYLRIWHDGSPLEEYKLEQLMSEWFIYNVDNGEYRGKQYIDFQFHEPEIREAVEAELKDWNKKHAY